MSFYKQSIDGYVRKVGVKRITTLTFPLNANFRFFKGFYAKLGLSASLGIAAKDDIRYFNDTPEINELYNSMQDIFKPHSLGFGLGCSYRIGKFDITYYRRTTISDIAHPVMISDSGYNVFGRLYSNSLSVIYLIPIGKNSD